MVTALGNQPPVEEPPVAAASSSNEYGLDPQLPGEAAGEDAFGLAPYGISDPLAAEALPSSLEAAAGWEAAPIAAPKARKKPEKAPPAAPNRRMWLLGGIGGAVACLLLVGLIWLFSGGGEDQPGNAGGNLAAADPAKFVVVDAPPAGAEAPRKQVVFTPTAAAKAPPKASVAAAPSSTPLWNLRVDKPQSPPEPIPADLNIPIVPTAAAGVALPPLLAGLGGPYLMTGPPWKENPYYPRNDKNGKPIRPADQPQPPSPVIDLRTGKPAGEFAFLAPFAIVGSRLGPDAQYLITPDANFDTQRTNREGILDVWKQGEPVQVADLKMPGHVTWLEFIAPEHVAMFAYTPQPQLQIWRVSTGELFRKISFPEGHFSPLEVPNLGSDKFWFNAGAPFDGRSPTVGAVSPTGRYVALGGDQGIIFISTTETRLVGLLPIESRGPIRYDSMNFSPDGALLYAVSSYARPPSALNRRGGRTLNVWDAGTGRMVLDLKLQYAQSDNELSRAPLLAGGIPDTILFGRCLADRQVCFGRVIETMAGSTVLEVPYTPLRWAGPNRLLVLANDGEKNLKVSAIDFDSAAIIAQAGERLTDVASRPPVLKADRSDIQPASPQPPGEWIAPPAAGKLAAVSAERVVLNTLKAWNSSPPVPAAESDGQTLVLTYHFMEKPRLRHELHAQLFDLASGRELGPSLRLWPWSAPADVATANTPSRRPPLPLSALTADGKQFAVRDPANLGRVDVWTDAGTRLGGLAPYDGDIDWIGWSSSGKLLTVGDGKLTAWDAATGVASYEVEGGYSGPVGLCHGGAWLAAAAGDAVDLIDAETGKCLGRLKPVVPGGAFAVVTVSPDGKSVAAARPVAAPQPTSVLESSEGFLSDIWDLTTGKAASTPFGGTEMVFFQGFAPQQALALTATVDQSRTGGYHPEYFIKVELLDRGAVVCQYKLAHLFPKFDNGLPALVLSPRGRAWVKKDDKWLSQTLANPATASDRAFFDTTAQPLRIEVDVGNRDAAQQLAQKLAGELQQKGFTIGPGGWALRVEHQVADSKKTLSFGNPRNGKPIPEVRFVWRLLDGGGAVIWQGETIGQFAGTASRYYTKSKMDGVASGAGGAGIATSDYFNFKGDMRTAVVAEILETQAAKQSPPRSLPVGKVMKTASGYQTLPLTAEIKRD